MQGGCVKEIPLTRGLAATVDDEDFDRVSRYKWCAQVSDRKTPVALRGKTADCPHRYMHRFILDAKPGELVDHINGDTLDNRRANLRLCSNAENLRNRGATRTNRSGFKGVSWSRVGEAWIAQITVNYECVHLGYFKTKEDAAKAYDDAALRYHGEFAHLNFPKAKA